MILSIAYITEILQSGDFDKLIGFVEDAEVEVKGTIYQLSDDRQKHELAKDVSALGNAGGGIILIGFQTEKDISNAAERITECRPHDLGLVSPEQYRNVLQDWICPPIHSVHIECYSSLSDKTRGVTAIVVTPEAADGKPYIVKRWVEENGKVRGTLIGYYERVLDRVPPTSAETLRTWLNDGKRFNELSNRLVSIEGLIANLPVAALHRQDAGPTEEDVSKRIEEAKVAVNRTKEPIIVLAAIAENRSGFPQLFRSRSEQVVRLLDDLPTFRNHGFNIGNHLSRPSEIVRGELRRRLTAGRQIIDLWRDGMLVAIGEGDYELLCWYTRNPSNPAIAEQNLIIRNFVLAEVALTFANLALEVVQVCRACT
jgi:hypothetical protein